MKKHEYPNLGETLYEEVLPNGLSVLVAVKPGFRKNAAFFATRYGGADRRFKVNGEWIDTPAGVAHFLEHKMFDMPDGRNVLSDFAALGASPNAFTGAGLTAYHFTGSENFMENLRLLLTYVSTPYYTDESVAKEQGIIAQEIRMGEDSPGYAGYFQLMSALYDHHPIRENIAGSVESIAQITPETLYHCHSVFYHPSNMALCCVGDVDPEAIAAAAREILPDTPGEKPERDYGAPETLLPGRKRVEKTMSVSAPQFLLGVKLPYLSDGAARERQKLLAELAGECLLGKSSAFYNDLYAKGLLNGDFAVENDSAAGTAVLLFGAQSRDPDAVAEAVHEAVSGVALQGLDKDALERCRRAKYGRLLGSLDSFAAYAVSLAESRLDGWNALDAFAALESVTLAECEAFLCENLTRERLALSVIRPNA